jgi:hypothetical protein
MEHLTSVNPSPGPDQPVRLPQNLENSRDKAFVRNPPFYHQIFLKLFFRHQDNIWGLEREGKPKRLLSAQMRLISIKIF